VAILSRLRGKGSEATPKTVLAASVPLSGPHAVAVGKSLRPGTEDWQKEAWYHYDGCGEFRSAITWVANAVSKADVFAAEIDPETGTVGGPTDNANAQKAALAVLGGMASRAQLLKTLAVHWQVPGESFIIVRPRSARANVEQPDEWLAISGTKVQYKGGTWQYQDPSTMALVTLRPGTDRLIRVWSPHPNDGSKADSAARPALPILREIEKSSQNIAGRLDSRLAGNGILPIPAELDFPRPDGQSLGESFGEALLQAAEASLRSPGTAAAHVPLIVPMPAELIEAFKGAHMDLATALDGTVMEIRVNALGRLAHTLDMPNETAEGSTGGMNHWGAWKVEEDTYKIYVEPLLEMLGDACTREWFWDVLSAMGESDPQRYVLAWETSSIVSRPDRTAELKDLWDDALISDDFRRAEQGIPDDAAPAEDELQLRRLERVVMGAPTLAADPEIANRLFGFEIAPAAANVDPAAIETPAGESVPEQSRALPSRSESADEPEAVPEGLVAAAEFAVFDALSRAGKRLLTRGHRGQFGHVKAEELYLTIDHDRTADELLEGSFAWINEDEYPGFTGKLRAYSARLIDSRTVYQRATLKAYLR
jgi:hypothetical protein